MRPRPSSLRPGSRFNVAREPRVPGVQLRRGGARRAARAASIIAFVTLLAGASWAQGGIGILDSCLQAAPLFFSTEVDFLTRGPEPPDGNPIVSDGDLLALTGAGSSLICVRNADLLSAFQTTADLGLDAVDVLVDGEDRIVIFSTELDAPAPGSFRSGDLLATQGAAIPNEVLLQKFEIGYDVGLDAIHAVGSPRALIRFFEDAAQPDRQEWLDDPLILLQLFEAHGVDLWVSIEGTLTSGSLSVLLDGDLLSAREGTVVARNDQILPPDVPAGIPVRGIDFGLDAVSTNRSGELDSLAFSVEISHVTPPDFGESDLLGLNLGWRASGPNLVSTFEPASSVLGLDAVAVPEPAGSSSLAVGLGAVAIAGWRRRRGKTG